MMILLRRNLFPRGASYSGPRRGPLFFGHPQARLGHPPKP